ncbi:metallophosphoesterase family protein [Agromyces sp. NPDC058136]|uniref:metallophosphoesterase family protein n=1 Tax=Agromyces sp. NPDC058136 TaxID=3346354 RepID=UPI0036DE6B53
MTDHDRLVAGDRLVTSHPVVMAPRTDGFEVVWGVGRLARGWLEWEAPDGRTGTVTADAFGMVPQHDRVLRVRVSGWPAGSARRIRAVTEAIAGAPERHESGWKTVRTLDEASATARFAVWNDTHEREETLRALDDATPEVDVLVWNGDLCNDWKDPASFTSTVLNPAGRDVSAGRPLAIVVGNHDVRGTWAYQLEDFVATPEGRPFSAFRIGPVACLVLHTGEDKPDAHPTFEGRVAFEPLRAEQAEWLREATARPEIRDAPYRVVFCHIPLRWIDESPVDYDDEGYDWFSRMSRDAWHDALVAWGAQIVVSGHTHYRTLMPATGEFPYVQLISGGPDFEVDSDEAAAWIEGVADAEALVLTLRDLDGVAHHEVRLAPLA